MNAAAAYGIEVGYEYARADGGPGRLRVRDVEQHAATGEVLVFDTQLQTERRIGAFKLARDQYYLVDFGESEGRAELLKAMRNGEASAEQQRRLVALFKALEAALQEQQVHARRGAFVVANAEWRRSGSQEGERTWLCLRVEDGADLSCKGTRGAALDKAIERERERWPYS